MNNKDNSNNFSNLQHQIENRIKQHTKYYLYFSRFFYVMSILTLIFSVLDTSSSISSINNCVQNTNRALCYVQSIAGSFVILFSGINTFYPSQSISEKHNNAIKKYNNLLLGLEVYNKEKENDDEILISSIVNSMNEIEKESPFLQNIILTEDNSTDNSTNNSTDNSTNNFTVSSLGPEIRFQLGRTKD